MEALQALVLTSAQLSEMLTEAAKQGAALAVAELRSDLHQTPEDAVLHKLRAFIADPISLINPQDHWANSAIIRQIAIRADRKPKSTAWFMKFQRETGLIDCFSRPGAAYGRRREWSFADIKLAWDAYYRKS